VIAIIAILAAILFPVFANARDKARQISDLSNIKQIALSTIMYTNDYDDTYPIGASARNAATNWKLTILPYAGSLGIYSGPDDVNAGQPAPSGANGGWAGVQTSYGANGFEGQDGIGGNWGEHLYGVFAQVDFGTATAGVYEANTTVDHVVTKLASATQPTQTILFSDLQSSDVNTLINTASWNDWENTGNASSIGNNSLIGNWDVESFWTIVGVNPGTGQTATTGTGHDDTQYNTWQIPSPDRNATAAYPFGPNGIVSAPFSNKSLTNFAFLDGHAKAQKPAATNPDATVSVYSNTVGAFVSLDQNNEWIVGR